MSWFAGDENSSLFAEPIEAVDGLLVPSITLAEVFKSIQRQRDEDTALIAIAHMAQGQMVDLDEGLAVTAAYLGVGRTPPLADSIIYATAQKYGALVWTQDSDFEGLEGVRFVPEGKTARGK